MSWLSFLPLRGEFYANPQRYRRQLSTSTILKCGWFRVVRGDVTSAANLAAFSVSTKWRPLFTLATVARSIGGRNHGDQNVEGRWDYS